MTGRGNLSVLKVVLEKWANNQSCNLGMFSSVGGNGINDGLTGGQTSFSLVVRVALAAMGAWPEKGVWFGKDSGTRPSALQASNDK